MNSDPPRGDRGPDRERFRKPCRGELLRVSQTALKLEVMSVEEPSPEWTLVLSCRGGGAPRTGRCPLGARGRLPRGPGLAGALIGLSWLEL